MDDPARDLVTSMLSVFSSYVDGRLEELEIDRPASFDNALTEGEAWLGANLEALLSLPFGEQRRGPLEVFQEAMWFPTEALAGAGIEAIPRDPGEAAALPGDLYNLAPASSRQLGDEVWEAHLAWGATKARSFDRSREVGLLSANLIDRSRIEPVVEQSGSSLVVWGAWVADIAGLTGHVPDLVLVDLSAPGALTAVEDFAQAGVRVIAFGPHVDREKLRSAKQAGADQVLARSRFFEQIGEIVG
jgi:CheY-like chemotaxis protein